jgi:Mrp family chromosome partitioning ATPase
MSKIYEALRRHENKTVNFPGLGDQPIQSRGPLVRALESVYPVVYRLAKDAGHGLVLHFVAASHGEGASTLGSEFAAIAARVADSRVLLVDADRTELTTAANFGCATDLGIFDRAQAGQTLEERIVSVPDNPQLQVGVLCGQRSPPLSRKAMPMLYEQFRAKYDLTVIDCPAVFSDRYFELSPEATDGVVLVVQAERNRPEIIRQAQSLIENAGGKLIGAILNRRHTYIPEFLYRLL